MRSTPTLSSLPLSTRSTLSLSLIVSDASPVSAGVSMKPTGSPAPAPIAGIGSSTSDRSTEAMALPLVIMAQ